MLAPRVFGDVSKGSGLVLVILEFPFDTLQDKVSPRGRRDDMPPPMAVRRWHIVLPPIRPRCVRKIAADLRPSADGSAVRTSLVAGGG